MRDREQNDRGENLRGLSRNQICIGVATDRKHTVCFVEGYGRPSQKSSYDTFHNHIAPGSVLIWSGILNVESTNTQKSGIIKRNQKGKRGNGDLQ